MVEKTGGAGIMKRVKFYNPREMSEEILEEMFVGREAILNEILEDLRRQSHSKTRQHWIISGPRGIGKTHLVGMIYHRVRRDEELSRAYLPIWTGEADAYEIYSAQVLLSKIAQRYLEEIQKTDEAAAVEFSRTLEEISADADESLFEELCELLKDEAKKRKKILLVMMENLDEVLSGFAPRASISEMKKLRSLLTHDREFLFINTTPANHINKLSNPKEPLFGQFKSRALGSLSEEDMCAIFEKLGILTGQEEKGKSFCVGEKSPVTRKVLHRLVGGNARSVVMAFEILSSSSQLDTLIDEFNSLLDVHTAYFEARLAHLAPRERAIVAAMSLSRENLTLQEIAKATKLPERSLSTQVDRLIEEGHVVKVGGAGGKGTIYSITDGLFRLWYQYRYGKKILEPLVRFIALWFELPDIENMQKEFESKITKEVRAPFEKMEYEATRRHIEAACKYAMCEDGKKEKEMIWAECGKEIQKKELAAFMNDLPKDMEELRKFVERDPATAEKNLREAIVKLESSEDEETRVWLIRAKIILGVMLVELNRSNEGISLYREIIERFIESDHKRIKSAMAITMLNLGIILTKLDLNEEALKIYKKLIKRYGMCDESEIRERVIMAMINLGVTLGKLGRDEEAIQEYSELIERFGESDNAEIIDNVAKAMLYRGITLGELGRDEEEIQEYNELIKRFGKSNAAEIIERVAKSMLYRGDTLGKLGRIEEAIQEYSDLIERFGESDNAEIIEQVAMAMLNRGITLGKLGRDEEEIQEYNELIKRFGESDNAEITEQVAMAMLNRGITLGKLGRDEEEIQEYNELIKRFGKSNAAEIIERVAKAMLYRGITLGKLNRDEEAIQEYSVLIKRFGESDNAEIIDNVARAMLYRGITLGELGRDEEEIQEYNELIKRFGKSNTAEIIERVAKSMLYRGDTLGKLGRIEEAIQEYSDLIERFGESDNTEIIDNVARAMLYRGITLGKLNRDEEAIQEYSDLIERFGESDEAEIKEQVAKAMLNRGITLGKLNRDEEAIQEYSVLIKHFGESDEAVIKEQVAKAMLRHGSALGKLDFFEDETSIYKDLIKRYGNEDNKRIKRTIAFAMTYLAIALGKLGKPEEEISVYNELLKCYGASDDIVVKEVISNAVALLESTKKMLNKVDEFGEYVSKLVNLIASQAEKYHEFPIETFFYGLLPSFPLLTIERWIDTLESAGGKIGEKASLYRFVLNVVKAGEPSSGKESKKGPAERIRKALARVPPELRQTVEEMAESIRKERRHIK
ncbi:MAG: tetratricopeptide repeat protein [Vulcanimicrobiota bacterium]